MSKPLSATTISIVKATVPALAAHGPAITVEMYKRLFQNKEVRSLFNQANQGEHGAQVNALAMAILGYARNIENLGALAPVVERVAHKHVGFNILPEHYPYVAEALLGAIAHVLGPAATPEILAAWGEAYWFLANILKGREKSLRDDLLAAEGGWTGWRDFVVVAKTRESAVITSFLLKPADGGKVVQHKPGQYLTFTLSPDENTILKRNYSISSGPNQDSYRISVKREPASQGGSAYLHDHVMEGSLVKVAPPSGDFFLTSNQNRPVILLSAGVGLTPMMSMLEAITSEKANFSTYYIHAALNSDTHAMRERVKALAQQHSNTKTTIFYSTPLAQDVPGSSHDITGFINIDWLQANTPLLDADVYLCGPRPFLRNLVADLKEHGIASDRIHYEYFGPADEQLAA
ncbi:MAG: NO-inducible flavohemoprotein [Rhodospirillales bacterium]|nr:NO-inducible flavohemoprotein [Rhodospirillales bacterium]